MTRPERADLPLLPVSAAECTRVAYELATLDGIEVRLPAPRRAYLLVTPLGMPEIDWLRAELARQGVRPTEVRRIDRWREVTTGLQARGRDALAIERAVLYEHAWAALFPDAGAEAWSLSLEEHARVHRIKSSLREGMRTVGIALGDGSEGRLHPFHLADPDRASLEALRLEWLLRTRP